MKRRLLAVLLIAAVLAGAIIASVTGYHVSRNATNQETFFGDFDNPDRVEITAWISQVDPTKQTLAMTLTNIRPSGKWANEQGGFADDATLVLNSLGDWDFPVKGGESADDHNLTMGIFGPITDYPFDRYDASIELHLYGPDGQEIPTAITVLNSDAFFSVDTAERESASGGTVIDLSIRRSASTRVFAIFIMVLMLGLAAAAATAAYYILRFKRGLIFPACSLMAAILFALIPLRNAVPGNPPIGSIIDFGSFFLAEAIIAISLISCVVVGYRHQLRIERNSE